MFNMPVNVIMVMRIRRNDDTRVWASQSYDMYDLVVRTSGIGVEVFADLMTEGGKCN